MTGNQKPNQRPDRTGGGEGSAAAVVDDTGNGHSQPVDAAAAELVPVPAGDATVAGPALGAEEVVPVRTGRIHSLIGFARANHWLVRLLIAASIVSVSAVTNRTYLGWGLFVTVAVLFVPVGRARSFVLSFVPYAMVWFLFTFLRSLADETILAHMLNTSVARFERWLFGGQLPTMALQDRFLDMSQLRLHDYFLTGIHWSYFIVPHVVAVRLWQKNPVLFRHYLSATTLLLAVGLAVYFAIPTNPPWLAPDPVNSPAAAPVIRVMDPVGRAIGGGLYTASYQVIGESNPIAAMPSIHMAITFLLPFVAFAAGMHWRRAALIYSGLMGVALVYLGEHYVVDIVVGMLIAAYAWFAAGYWLDRVAPVLRGRFAPAAVPQRAPHGVGA